MFFFTSRAEKIYENYNNFRAIIASDGQVRWEPGGVFKTMCQIDITYYPFDEQVENTCYSSSTNTKYSRQY